MDRIAEMLSVLPPPMRDPVLFAVPFFVLFLIIEWTAARRLEHDEDRPAPGSYRAADARASINLVYQFWIHTERIGTLPRGVEFVFNTWELETGEDVAIARDVRSATTWRDRLSYILGPPGWEPSRATATPTATPTATATGLRG